MSDEVLDAAGDQRCAQRVRSLKAAVPHYRGPVVPPEERRSRKAAVAGPKQPSKVWHSFRNRFPDEYYWDR